MDVHIEQVIIALALVFCTEKIGRARTLVVPIRFSGRRAMVGGKGDSCTKMDNYSILDRRTGMPLLEQSLKTKEKKGRRGFSHAHRHQSFTFPYQKVCFSNNTPSPVPARHLGWVNKMKTLPLHAW